MRKGKERVPSPTARTVIKKFPLSVAARLRLRYTVVDSVSLSGPGQVSGLSVWSPTVQTAFPFAEALKPRI